MKLEVHWAVAIAVGFGLGVWVWRTLPAKPKKPEGAKRRAIEDLDSEVLAAMGGKL